MAKNVVFLLHHTGTGASAIPQLFCSMYGYTMFRIDTLGTMPIGPDNFKSLDEALEDPRFVGWHWVFFDAKASDSLSKYVHQKDKVVYVFGSDTDGWNRSLDALPGSLVHVNSAFPPTTEHVQALCAITVVVHRFYQEGI